MPGRRRRRMMEDEDYKTISMLLDVEHFYGEHQGNLGPILIFLILEAIPVLLFIYWGLYLVVPSWISITSYLIYFVRILAITRGDEKTRLEDFRKRLNDDYSDLEGLVNIKKSHPDGGVEFTDGSFKYAVVLHNKTLESDLARGPLIKKFLNQLVGDFSYDMYNHNIVESRTLQKRYSKVTLFPDVDAAKDFIDIIDHNSKIVHKSSLLTRTVIIVKGQRADWKDMKLGIDSALQSKLSKMFKKSYRVTDFDELEEIMSRDLNANININDTLRAKYRTGNYRGSKVVAYDNLDILNKEKESVNITGFHVDYEEDIK